MAIEKGIYFVDAHWHRKVKVTRASVRTFGIRPIYKNINAVYT